MTSYVNKKVGDVAIVRVDATVEALLARMQDVCKMIKKIEETGGPKAVFCRLCDSGRSCNTSSISVVIRLIHSGFFSVLAAESGANSMAPAAVDLTSGPPTFQPGRYRFRSIVSAVRTTRTGAARKANFSVRARLKREFEACPGVLVCSAFSLTLSPSTTRFEPVSMTVLEGL
ncbi:MAG: hypothetical protein NTZ11_06925 [Gammaproteobacteria bacterium]|nr:hypothetical protein [Gammaproteobacteria bacterium]